MKRQSLSPFATGVFLLLLSGCSSFLGGFKTQDEPHFQEEMPEGPVTGGRWAGGGLLSPEKPFEREREYLRQMRSPAGGALEDAEGNARPIQLSKNLQNTSMDGPTSGPPQPIRPGRYKNGERATRADFVDESQSEGSLWASDGQTNYYFTKNKVRGVGDMLSLVIEEDLLRDIGLETKRTLSAGELAYEYQLAKDRIRKKALSNLTAGIDAVSTSAAAPARSPASKEDANGGKKESDAPEIKEDALPAPRLTDIDMNETLLVKKGDVMMGEIIERYPNGNYRIQAKRRIPYKGGAPRYVVLEGIVKGSDISEDDTLNSGKLYEYRVASKQ